MRSICVFLTLIPALAGAAPSSLQFVPLSNITAQGVLPMANGSVAVFGAATGACYLGEANCSQTQFPVLSVLNASGNQSAALSGSALGSGNSSIAGAAVDASGNIWITGETDSDDFPLTHPLFSQKQDYKQIGFVAKLDPDLNILFATFLGGQEIPAAGGSYPTNIALDDSGNVYVVGYTGDSGFPTTGPVFGAGSPMPLLGLYTFVSKISPDGSTLLFSRLLGGDLGSCVGSACLGYAISTTPSAIAVDANGNVTVAGGTSATNFPITSNVYQTGGGAFVSRISSDGSRLIWSTELGTTFSVGTVQTYSTAQSIALDASGNVYISGSAPVAIATTPGALQPTVPTPEVGFAAKLSSDATQLLFATNLSGTNGATLSGLALDPAGNVWITGYTLSSDFPGLTNTPSTGVDFALELNANATALQQIFTFVPATVTQPPAFDSNRNLLLLGSAGNLLRLNISTALTAPALFAITNSAVPKAMAGVAEGALTTLYGVGLGPSAGIAAAPDANGLYPTQLGGVSVAFNGVAAPLLYVGPNQINFQVPFNLIYYLDTMTITTPTGALPPIQVSTIGSLGVFGVLNQDGSLNSPSHPAPSGSIVSLYATGLGAPSSSAQDGAISPSAVSAFQNSIEVGWTDSLYPLPLLYAGTAPGLINGLDQLNVQLPSGFQNPTLFLNRLNPANGSAALTSNLVVVYTQ